MDLDLNNRYILGIQIGHKSSVALYKNENLIYYNQEERLTKIKNDAALPIKCLDQVKNITSSIDMVMVTSYDGGHHASPIKYYLLRLNLIKHDQLVFYTHKGHHLTHATKAYFSSGFKDALIFVVDGRGSNYNLSNGAAAYETVSVYKTTKDYKLKAIYKKLFTKEPNIKNLKVRYDIDYPEVGSIRTPHIDKQTKFEIVDTHTLAHMYTSVANFFDWHNEEGKLMGLSAYGKPNNKIKKLLNTKDFINNDSMTINRDKFPEITNHLETLAFETQKKFENDYFDLVKKYVNKNPKITNIVCTGGASLNVVNNLNLLEKFKKLNIYIDPMCGDEGNSIGTCQQYLHAINKFFTPIKNIYLGPNYSIKFNLNVDEKIKKVNTKNIIKLLTDKNIVAVYQQKAEAGPRALGNRSLLMDPRIKNGNDIMNTIKGREKFRPLACCILEEKAKEWFEMKTLKKSPHMMYAVKAKNKTKKLISSIVHKDNTCRVQTISKKDNPFMYQLLIEFYKKTKVPILMNTSFNLRKKPIVETPDDALETLRNSEFEYLFFPDTKDLIYIKNFNPY
tara:strand:+ start:774 stop:2459 length:1686 start_codon:yes stop_codon:yes gene_type:complete